MRKTSIIILTYNNLNYNKGCLESIRKYTKLESYEIIMVDNMSTDGTREWLVEQTDIKFILNDENMGFPKGCNIGIAAAEKTNDILLLNNDVEVCHNWLDNLQKALYSNPKFGGVQAVNSFHYKGALNERGEAINFDNEDTNQIHDFAKKNNVSDQRRWHYTNTLNGFCMLFKREVVDKIGGLDERFSPGNFEDDDISVRILIEGYFLLICHDSFVHHFHNKSFNKDQNPNKYWNLIQTNSNKFINKWGFNSDDKYQTRMDLLNVMDADSNKAINVLHIGCGLGRTLFEIKNTYPLACLYGIETNENYTRIIENVINISTKPLEEFPLEFEEKLFDYILIGEMFEKVKEPHVFLKQIREYLKSDGYLITSVQNIMHFSVIRNLLYGQWYYANGDVLDRGKEFFLTSNDISKLFKDCGYVNEMIFHWYSNTVKEDEEVIDKLSEIGLKDKRYLYQTYLFAVKFQNSELIKQMNDIKDETRYLLRRIENDIESEKSLITIIEYIKRGLINLSTIDEIILKDIIKKDDVKIIVRKNVDLLIEE